MTETNEKDYNMDECVSSIRDRCNVIKPLVVIECITYNHGSYIRDALEGFVMQKTDFPFVAIVHDDASTDNTSEIVSEYAEKYPDLILPILERENQLSKKDDSLARILTAAKKATGAKYVALCEGDDFWTDSHKLQKQVDFLDTHPDYSMVFHAAFLKFENDVKPDSRLAQNYNSMQQRDYSLDEILSGFIVPTCSAVYRISILNRYKRDKDYCVGDNVLWTTCATSGKIYCIADKMSTYRVNNGGWVRSNQENRPKQLLTYNRWIKHYQALRRNFSEIKCRQMYLNEVTCACQITYIDIVPKTNIIKNVFGYTNKYKLLYLRILMSGFCKKIFNRFRRLYTN